MGHKRDWKDTIRNFIYRHLADLSTGAQLIKSMLREFEVDRLKFGEWER